VGDIYGGDCKGLNLPKDLIAGFFTKIPDKVKIESFTKSWLMMISCNIAQMITLLTNLHNMSSVMIVSEEINNENFFHQINSFLKAFTG